MPSVISEQIGSNLRLLPIHAAFEGDELCKGAAQPVFISTLAEEGA